MPSDVGSRIARRRQQLHLTQAKLAARLGVSRGAVTSWETGMHYPGRHLGALEAVLGISLADEDEEFYTDPVEQAIWEDPALPKVRKRELIGQLRTARRDHIPRAHEPPA
jgi:transcriptional regulator with XRE-family HTH domain